MNRFSSACFAFLFCAAAFPATAGIWVEAESFARKGGWVVDQQFSDRMGSDYLMAHGLGVPVGDAATTVVFPKAGRYTVFVRTYNWTSPWCGGPGPGRFTVSVGGKRLGETGASGNRWEWQKAGEIDVPAGAAEVALHDLTGFNGRCDALWFTTDPADVPPADGQPLAAFRKKQMKVRPQKAGDYDLVVAGGGIAGMCAAVSAARLGLRVALVNDRPVLGGNNSSEIRVHLGGRVGVPPYPQLGNLVREVGPVRGGNAQPADYYEDGRKDAWIAAEPNITLFPSYRIFAVSKRGARIASVTARHIETGEERVFSAPLFADCTGDGTVGYLAGADYRMGREGRSEYGESTAPERPDSLVMGASVQWYSKDTGEPASFPLFRYGLDFNEQSAERVTMGEWTWETGMNRNQIDDFEYIRDYGLMVVFSNWSFLKNEASDRAKYAGRALDWVAYIAGKRESRRLLGDYVLREDDLRNWVEYEDGTASTTWSIDLHYPDPANSRHFKDNEFKSVARHIDIYPYPIPYRCLYSRNVDNLFMAGRNISVTHVALGTVRVMRTTGMMGEVVGMAAMLCKKYGLTPRGVYDTRLDELKGLMRRGTGYTDAPDNQRYNQGGTLPEKPGR